MPEKDTQIVQMVPITHIRPYWRNPRINDDAVHAVASSLKRYGFQTPMVVDMDMEIIAGHCRYRAAQSLGLKEVPVVVVDLPDAICKQLRVADNKTAEFAKWDNSKLEEELSALKELTEVRDLFSGAEWDTLFSNLPSAEAIAETPDVQPTSVEEVKGGAEVFEVPCPHCGENQSYTIKDNRVTDKDQKEIQKRTDEARKKSVESDEVGTKKKATGGPEVAPEVSES